MNQNLLEKILITFYKNCPYSFFFELYQSIIAVDIWLHLDFVVQASQIPVQGRVCACLINFFLNFIKNVNFYDFFVRKVHILIRLMKMHHFVAFPTFHHIVRMFNF